MKEELDIVFEDAEKTTPEKSNSSFSEVYSSSKKSNKLASETIVRNVAASVGRPNTNKANSEKIRENILSAENDVTDSSTSGRDESS